LKDIQGIIVDYPLYFLDDENYLPGFRTAEGENLSGFSKLHIRTNTFDYLFFFFLVGIVPIVTWT
jgi:hypothetical protein